MDTARCHGIYPILYAVFDRAPRQQPSAFGLAMLELGGGPGPL